MSDYELQPAPPRLEEKRAYCRMMYRHLALTIVVLFFAWYSDVRWFVPDKEVLNHGISDRQWLGVLAILWSSLLLVAALLTCLGAYVK
jgi:hypothetical protein